MVVSQGIGVIKQVLELDCDLLHERLFGHTDLHLCLKPPTEEVDGGDANIPSMNGLDKDLASSSDGAKAPGTWDAKVKLNCRQVEISRVQVNGKTTSYSKCDFLKKIVVQENIRDLNTYYACLAGDMIASKDGELEVVVPESERKKRELVIRIDYELTRPKAGVVFAACGDFIPDKQRCVEDGYRFTKGTNKKRYFPHMYTYASLCGGDTVGAGCGARCWFPCLDTLQARCPFELRITVPEGLTCVASGKLEQEKELEASGKVCFTYIHEDPIAPHNVALCVGPFEKVSSPKMSWVQVYHLPDEPKREIEKAMWGLRKSIKEMFFYLQRNAFPGSSFKQVFIDREFAYTDVAPFSTLSFVSNALLSAPNQPSPDKICGSGLMFEGDKHIHFLQAQAVAYNYFGCLVPAKSENDLWVIAGLSGFLAYRYALKTFKLTHVAPDTNDNTNGTGNPSGTGKKHNFDLGSTDPREILSHNFPRFKRAKRRFDAVHRQIGLPGNVMQRPLHKPSEVTLAVDSCLWRGRGFELNCLWSQRAFFFIHMLERFVNAGLDQDEGMSRDDDTFANIIRSYVSHGLEQVESHKKWFKDWYASTTDNNQPEMVLASQPKQLIRTPSTFNDNAGFESEMGDVTQRMMLRNKSLVGISELEYLIELCKVGGLKPRDFSSQIQENFADNWLNSCSYLQLRGSAEYRNGQLECILEQVPARGVRPMHLQLRLRVVEEDDTWHHEKALVKERGQFNIQVHAQKQKQRGGRKSLVDKERITKWENPAGLATEELLTILMEPEEGEERIWHNEFPVKYAILDPDLMYMRDVEWRQSEIMFLELLNDPNLVDPILQQCFALRQMAIPSNVTDDITVRGNRAFEHADSNGPQKSSSSSGNANNVVSASSGSFYDIRMVAAIAQCIVDWNKPARVRAEAVLRLSEWQWYHRPNKAAYDKDGGARLEDRMGSHPWVGLNLLLLALQRTIFNQDTGALLPNDFSVHGEFALKRAIANGLKQIKAKSGKPPKEVCDMVLTLLRFNDNSINKYDDGIYIRDLVLCAAEIVMSYVSGTFDEEQRATDATEKIGHHRTPQDILGPYFEIVHHIKRLLRYDAIEPSPGHIVTLGCLQALAMLESHAIIPADTPYFAYAVHNTPVPEDNPEAAVVAKHDWGAAVREEAFKAIITTYIANRTSKNIFRYESEDDRTVAWVGVIKWLLETIVKDPCPQTRWNVVKHLLALHADTVHQTHAELDNHKSPSGIFFPLSNSIYDISNVCRVRFIELASTLWRAINNANEFDSRMRLGLSQFWRAIWQLETPPILKDTTSAQPVPLGDFAEWANYGNAPERYRRRSPVNMSAHRAAPSPPRPTKKIKVKLNLKR